MPNVDGDIILSAGLDTKGVKDGVAKLNKTVSKALKNTIRIAFGVRSVFALIRKLRSALIDGFGNLAQVHEPFNKALSELMTSLNLLKNTFAAAFAPIIETVAPILSYFINLMAKAVSVVGQFLAALTGKEYVQAAATQVDYAKSVNKSTSSSKKNTKATKDQTKAAKELKKTLAGFDDIEILHEDKDTSSSTPDTTTTPDYSFSTMPVGEAADKFAKDFMAAWAKADFTDLGRIVGEKIRDALEKIKWDEIHQTLYKIGKSLATFLNGVIETKGFFRVIGTTIAQALNSALTLVYGFVHNFHWSSLGTGIGEGLNSAVAKFNWNLLANTLIDAINGVFDMWYNFVTTFNFDAFGTHIGETISKVLNGIDWEKGATNVAETINGLFRALRAAVVKISWKLLGKKIIRAVVKFFHTLKWEDYGNTLSELIKGLLEALKGAVEEVKWDEVPQYVVDAISDFFEGFDWQGIADSAIELLEEALLAALDILKGIFDKNGIDEPFTTALNNLKDTISQLSESIDFSAIADGLGRIVTALSPAVRGFATGFLEVFDDLAKIGIAFLQALGPALQKIADALESVDPETLRKIGEYFGAIVATLLTLNTAKTAITVFGGFVAKLQSLLEMGGALPSFGSMIFGVGNGLKNVGDGAEAAAEGLDAAAEATETSGTAASGASKLVGGFNKALSFLSETTIGRSIGMNVALSEAFNRHVLPALDGSRDAAFEASGGFSTVSKALYDTTEPGKQVDKTIGELTGKLLAVSNDPAPTFAEAFGEVAQSLEDAGVDTTDFKERLSTLLSEGAFNESQAEVIKNYIGNIGTSAQDANSDTGDLGKALDSFAGLGWTLPLKIALLSGAIDLLANSGKLSKEQTEKLHETLDNYKAEPTQDSMKKVSDAFDDVGISADDMRVALVESSKNLGKEFKPELDKIVKNANGFAEDLGDAGDDGGEKFANGLTNQLEGVRPDVSKTVEAIASDDMLGTLDTELDSHSPSREAAKRGRYFIEGLQSGIDSTKGRFMSVVQSVANDMVDKFDETDWTSIGTEIVTKINDGIVQTQYNVISSASELASSIYDNANSADWVSIGSNICSGIVNGLWGGWNWVVSVAQDLAISAYNAARWALGIASPSKKFAWIGEMVTEGFGKGITDNENNAVDAMSDLTSAVSDEAEKTNPAIALASSIDGWIESLDFILTEFSNTVIDKFDSLISSLETITQLSISGVPDIANGKVIPSSIRTSSASADTMGKLIESINGLTSNQITPDELRAMLVEVVRDYFSTTFYIGDEQIARHANAGNLKLDVKYNIM